MRRRWIGLAIGALTLVSGSLARAADVGCCETECHTADGAGRGLHSMQRRDMTQTECASSSPGCDARWSAEACDANPEGATIGIRGSAVREEPDEGE